MQRDSLLGPIVSCEENEALRIWHFYALLHFNCDVLVMRFDEIAFSSFPNSTGPRNQTWKLHV
jgi:hypothetical protein